MNHPPGGAPFFYTDPYGGYYVPQYEASPPPQAAAVLGGAGLSIGTGALVVLGLMALLVFEADKRVPK